MGKIKNEGLNNFSFLLSEINMGPPEQEWGGSGKIEKRFYNKCIFGKLIIFAEIFFNSFTRARMGWLRENRKRFYNHIPTP
jgi:hypothetical protein